MSKEITRSEIRDLIIESTGKTPKEAAEKETRIKFALREVLSDEKKEQMRQSTGTVGKIAIALAAGKGFHREAARFASEKWGATDAVAKALNASSDAAGAFMLTEELAKDMIELLRPMSIMRKMGCTMLPLVNGQLKWPKMTAASSAAYLSESGVIAASQQQFGQILFQGKKMGCKVPISNDLLKFNTAFNTEQIVRDDMLLSMGLREDLAFLEGDGQSDTPVGLRNLINASNVITMTATPTAVTATTDAGRMMTLLDNANVPDTRRGWIMRPSVRNWLATVREATGALAFPEVSQRGMFWNMPIATSTQLTIDVAGPPTQSYVYLCEFPQLVIADAYQVELAVSDVAAYTDSNSALVSTFDRDETVIRAISQHDFGVKHDLAVAALTGVTWGGA